MASMWTHGSIVTHLSQRMKYSSGESEWRHLLLGESVMISKWLAYTIATSPRVADEVGRSVHEQFDAKRAG